MPPLTVNQDLEIGRLQFIKANSVLKSVLINTPYQPKTNPVFIINVLRAISLQCDNVPNGTTYGVIVLLACFSRFSYLVPQTQTALNITRNLIMGDIIFASPGAHILVKWHKVMQSALSLKVVQIPQLLDQYPCPVAALKVMLKQTEIWTSRSSLCNKQESQALGTNFSRQRSMLASILATMHLNVKNLGFHTFRCSGTSFSFYQNMQLQNI